MPTPLPRGTSTGSQTTATIGAAGGTLSSDDGVFTLTVPPGALASDVMVGVEPITNTATLGAGSAYRLTPEGTTFSIPATVAFSFTAADVAGASNDALFVGYQGTDGYWHMMAGPVVDASAMTVSAQTSHFSDWGKVLGWQVQPPSATVPTGGQVMLQLLYCAPDVFEDPAGGDALAGLVPNCANQPELPMLVTVNGWQVNGGAGSADGTVMFDPSAPAFATYIAPSSPPAQNPVAVSVDFSPKSKQGVMKELAVSNITVGGGGGWSGTVNWTLTGKSTSPTDTYDVSGSGTVTVGPGPSSSGIPGGEQIAPAIVSLSAMYNYHYTSTNHTEVDNSCGHVVTDLAIDQAESGMTSDTSTAVVEFAPSTTDNTIEGLVGVPSFDITGTNSQTYSVSVSMPDGIACVNKPQSTTTAPMSDSFQGLSLQFMSSPMGGPGGALQYTGSTTVHDDSGMPPTDLTVTWNLTPM
jgi:hypothetical protein